MIKAEFDNHKWDLVVESPGRINIIGEHIDYNNCFVLPTAIDKTIQFKFKNNNNHKLCNIYSRNLEAGLSFNIDEVKISKQNWENYILGVIHEMTQLTDGLRGFDCEIDSNIPIGSGLSSSAALECGLAYGLNELFNLGLSKKTIVQLSQRAEHNYVGTKCGIMDQFASVMSKKGQVILLDCESLDFEYVPIDIEPFTLLLLNTNITHDLSAGEYNLRRNQCEMGVSLIQQSHPKVNSLRHVSLKMIEELKDTMDEIVFKRCKYVVEEKNRVLDSVQALTTNNLQKMGRNLYETHKGLSELYEVSCPELDFLVDFTKENEAILGARMMGGGFGGCTINLIRKDVVEEFVKEVSAAYFEKFGIRLTSFEAVPDEGTRMYRLTT